MPRTQEPIIALVFFVLLVISATISNVALMNSDWTGFGAFGLVFCVLGLVGLIFLGVHIQAKPKL